MKVLQAISFRKTLNPQIMNKLLMALAFAFVLTACGDGRPGTTHQDPAHEHDPVVLYLTGYGESFEVFAESDPLVLGSKASVLAHFTRLENFRPLEEGKVTANLLTGNSVVRHTLDVPVRPGIFRFELQPETTGEGLIRFEIEWPGGSEIIEAGRVMVFDDPHAAVHHAEDLAEHIPGAVVFTKEQSWKIRFATEGVRRREFGPVIKTVGEVLPARGDALTLTAQTNGMVRFSEGNLFEGDLIAAGQALLTVTGGSLAEGNVALRLQEAQRRFERSRADYERLSELAQDQLVSEREVLQARQEYHDAMAAYDLLRTGFTPQGQSLQSSLGGRITRIYVEEGEYVEMGQPLLVVSRNQDLVIRAEVQQRYASLLSGLSSAMIRLADGRMVSLEELGGRVLSVARNIHPGSRLLPVHLQINRTEGLVPGGLVDVYLKATASKPVLVLPNSALIEEQGNYFVFVQLHPESFVKREVRIGQSDGLLTEIKYGLEEGERIVTRGAAMVKMAASSGDIDPHSGHVH